MGQFVDLKSADGFVLPAWVAEPDTTPRGAVVVLQEIFGVNSHIRAVAEQYLAGGRHLWNGGMFFVRAARLLAPPVRLERRLPDDERRRHAGAALDQQRLVAHRGHGAVGIHGLRGVALAAMAARHHAGPAAGRL